MSEVTAVPTPVPGALTGPIVSPREIAPYAVFGGIVFLLFIYFVGAEEGATSLISGMGVHEFVHDARHLLGFPCH